MPRDPRPLGFWGEVDTPRIMPVSRNMEPGLDAHIDFTPSPPVLGGSPLPFGSGGREETIPAYGFRPSAPLPETPSDKAPPVPPRVGNMEYLGQIAKTYLLVRRGGELLILDQHAVHERVRLHVIQKGGTRGESQLLALPLEMALHPSESEELPAVWEDLAALGFALQTEGPARLRVTGLPPQLSRTEAESFIRDALAGKKGGFDSLWHMMACRTAIKAGQELTADEAAGLMRLWAETPDSGYCPHGRPVSVTLTVHELEKLFKRKP